MLRCRVDISCFFFSCCLSECWQGAVYGILAAKLTNQPEDEPYSFQAHAVLLPWVSPLFE